MGDSVSQRGNNFNPFVDCREGSTCQRIDMNLICNTNLTTSGEGRCECRQDMKWNKDAGECQLFLDVDCSSYNYDTKPSPVILEAVNKTLEKTEEKNVTETSLDSKPDNATLSASPNATLSNSLLSSIDPKKASKADINEAYCRDVDSFSWEFNQPERYTSSSPGSNSQLSIGKIIGIVFGVLAVSILCCLCCVCCVCKGAKNALTRSGDDKHNSQPPVTFSSIQESGGAGAHYQPSYPPQQPGALPYPVNPGAEAGPPPIPPTQPGYSNYSPGYNSQPQPQPPYPHHSSAPYPPPYNPGY